jgi:hypothetical protein
MGLFSDGTEIINGGELLEGGIPTATIVPWSSASVPSGFLECEVQQFQEQLIQLYLQL